MSEKTNVSVNVSTLFENVSALIERSRRIVATAINTGEVYTKFLIGKYIVDFEQNGERRAQYGKQVIKELSDRLTNKFGPGWSVETLTFCRKFYIVYSKPAIESYESGDEFRAHWVRNSDEVKKLIGTEILNLTDVPKFSLSWSHYRILMRVENPNARNFYEIECAQQQWSKRELTRQVGSSLYERLA